MNTDSQIIQQTLTGVFGDLTVDRRLDVHEGVQVEIVKAENSPCDRITSFATVGLSIVPIGYISSNVILGAEIVGAANARFNRFTDVLAACVDDIFHLRFKLFPGAVYKNAFAEHYPELDVKHLIFDTPNGWENDLLSLNLGTRQVAWIMAVPVTDEELQLFSRSDTGELQVLFEEKGVDLYDLERESVV